MDVEDAERPPMGPQYIASWEGHRTTELYSKFPLQMVSPHPRFSFHTMGDSKESGSTTSRTTECSSTATATGSCA
jgi:trimethylamine-N-oxide reductase (cytochrome c)